MKETTMIAGQTLKIKYDGKYDWMEGDSRSYTVQSHFMKDGRDYYRCTFTGAQAVLNLLKGAN